MSGLAGAFGFVMCRSLVPFALLPAAAALLVEAPAGGAPDDSALAHRGEDYFNTLAEADGFLLNLGWIKK